MLITCRTVLFLLLYFPLSAMNSPQHMALFRAASNSHLAEKKPTSSWTLTITTWWEEKKEHQEVRQLAESYKQQGILDRKNMHNKTPLHEAAQYGNIVAVKALIAAGASPKIEDGDGKTALELATHPAIQRVLSQSSLL